VKPSPHVGTATAKANRTHCCHRGNDATTGPRTHHEGSVNHMRALKKSWRTRAKERELGLMLDEPPPDDHPNLAPRGLIPAAARWLQPRYVWEVRRWPVWLKLKYSDGVATNWDEVVGDNYSRPPGPK
jgi:hypothetical protein